MTTEEQSRHVRPEADTIRTVSPHGYYDKSWALVVGINDYGAEHARLANARNDAHAVADLLTTEYKFDQVVTLYDAEATHDVIIDWLRDKLPEQVGANDRLVFFFAGHGATRKGVAGQERGYLIPQDASAGKYADYIDMSELRDACGFIPAKHIFVILDCCFSGVAAVTTRATPPATPQVFTDAYLKRITERAAWQILTAGASDELAADSGSRPGHSAFTGALLAGLEGGADPNRDGIITASELANYVKPEVSRETTGGFGAGQTPYFNYLAGSGQGDFVFLRPDQPIRLAVIPPVWQQTNPVLRLPNWWWGVIGLLLVVIGTLGWLAWDSGQRSRRTERQLALTATHEAASTATAVVMAALLTETAAASTPTATPRPTLAPTEAPTQVVQNVDVAATRTAQAQQMTPPVTPATRTQGAPGTSPRPADLPYTGEGIRVALIGTGVDLNHPDLRGRITAVFDLTEEGIQEEHGYATFLAGVIAGTGAASNGQTRGLAPATHLYVAKISGAGAASFEALQQGVEWALRQDINILLVAFGGPANCDGSEPLSQRLNQAVDDGVIVVVSAAISLNDEESGTTGTPGCADKVITVGYTDASGAVAPYSGRGPTLDGRRKPDVVAPGELRGLRATTEVGDVTGDASDDRYYTRMAGPGPASAYVAGLVALMLEARPELTPDRVKQLLLETATDLGEDANSQGAGLVNIEAALNAATGESPLAKISSDAAYAVAFTNDFFGLTLEVPSIVLEDETEHNAYWDGQQYHAPAPVQYLSDITYYNMMFPLIRKVVDLPYQGQPGAILTSYATVFAALIKQARLGQTAQSADWLVAPGSIAWLKGEDPASAPDQSPLHSLKAPGTAYDDPVLGKDPQPAHLDDYVETTEDSGGVHLNSGILNRAFYEASIQIGTDVTAEIWYEALSQLTPASDFQQLANATVAAAGSLYGVTSAEQTAVQQAWTAVGIVAAGVS